MSLTPINVRSVDPLLQTAAEGLVRGMIAEEILPIFKAAKTELELRRLLKAHAEVLLNRHGMQLAGPMRTSFLNKFATAAIAAHG